MTNEIDLKILRSLLISSYSLTDLAKEVGIAYKNLLPHIKKLESEGWLETKKDKESRGQRVIVSSKRKDIEGRGLVRINKKYYGTYCNKVIDDLRTISTKTLHYISANIYSQQLVDNITSKIQFFSEKKQIVSTGYLYYILHKAESILSNSDISIPLVFSHGDLQTGNIWVNQTTNRVTLLDWETAKERSLWYDCATLLLSIRRKNMFSAMVSNMNDTNIIGDLLLLDTKKDYNMKTVMATLILEEMTFFVDEIFDLPDSLGAEIIDRFIYEMKHIKWIN